MSSVEKEKKESSSSMGSEAMTEANSAPKLSLFSLPNLSPEPQGMLTPPLRPPASVPFLWEEAPGKPRTCNEIDSKPKSSSARCLELPPRLLVSESKMTNIPSPTTVLEGPYIIGRSASCSVSFSRDRYSSSSSSGSPPERRGGGQSERVLYLHGKKEYSKERNGGGGYFGSWGRNNNSKQSSLKGGNEEVAVEDNFVISRSATVSCSSPSLSFGVLNGEEERKVDETRVKITRFRRRGSFLSLSSTTRSHFWASVYGTLKQVVPWGRTSSSSRKNNN